METKASIIKEATVIANKKFDKQMLDHIAKIRTLKGFHAQHRSMLLEYVYAHK